MPRPRPPGAAALAAALGGLAFSAAGVRAASSTAPIPACGYAVVASTGGKCKFAKAPDNKDQAQAEIIDPSATVIEGAASVRDVPFSRDGLKQVILGTFPASQGKPTSYADPPIATFTLVQKKQGKLTAYEASAALINSRENSIRQNDRPEYTITVQDPTDAVRQLPNGACTMTIRAPCCVDGEADFGSGRCVPAVSKADPCSATSDGGVCVTAFEDTFDDTEGDCVLFCPDELPFSDGPTCVASCPPGKPFVDRGACLAACPAARPDTIRVKTANGRVDACVNPVACTYADTACAADAACPGGTAVAAKCTDPGDRPSRAGNPCACTALKQLAALSETVPDVAPWNDLPDMGYCTDFNPSRDGPGILQVACVRSGAVQLPLAVDGTRSGFTGAVESSLGDLGPELTYLGIDNNAVTSVPTEVGALTGLTELDVKRNDLASMPTEVGLLADLQVLDWGRNSLTRVPTEVGALTSLRRATVSSNALTSLPTELGVLTGLLQLKAEENELFSIPTELGLLTSLKKLELDNNQLTGVPPEFRTVDPTVQCFLYSNPSTSDLGTFSCANVGYGTSCCTTPNGCGDNQPGGPCNGAPPLCGYVDTQCAEGSVCPLGTAFVSAECVDRSAFSENPCACTALQQLAALSEELQDVAPWNDLANQPYCTGLDDDYSLVNLDVKCGAAGAGTQLPTRVDGLNAGLAGAMRPSISALGPILGHLALNGKAAGTGITSVPTELGRLGSLTTLSLNRNALTSLPTEIGGMRSLVSFGIYENLLASLPTELGFLTKIRYLYLGNNFVTDVPSEIALLTSLTTLTLSTNELTGLPTEFQTVDPKSSCNLSNNPGASCANVGYATSCCTAANGCGDGPGGLCAGTPACTYADTTCPVGAKCPGGTFVSATCADRAAFAENPCACTALEQLAATSETLQNEAPWDDLANAAYCQNGEVEVDCVTVDGVQMPLEVQAANEGLTGAMPPSLGDLGPSLTQIFMSNNDITSLPTEIGLLTGLSSVWWGSNELTAVPTEIGYLRSMTNLRLNNNQLTALPAEIAILPLARFYAQNNALLGVPPEFEGLDPTIACNIWRQAKLPEGQEFSCENLSFGTGCCEDRVDRCGFGSRGGPCLGDPTNCTYTDVQCTPGMICPGGTVVSAECADPPGGGNPCACTALQELAGMSELLQDMEPWNDLANLEYCTGVGADFELDGVGVLQVRCETVGGVQLPAFLRSVGTGLAGALPPSVGDLGPALTWLNLASNAIESLPSQLGRLVLTALRLSDNAIANLPSEIGRLEDTLTALDLNQNRLTAVPFEMADLGRTWTGLDILGLADNELTGVPTTFRTVNPAEICNFSGNPGFDCANLGATTTCCTEDNCGDTATCFPG